MRSLWSLSESCFADTFALIIAAFTSSVMATLCCNLNVSSIVLHLLRSIVQGVVAVAAVAAVANHSRSDDVSQHPEAHLAAFFHLAIFCTSDPVETPVEISVP